MSLSLTYDEIRRELGRFLSISETPADWSSEDAQRVTDIIRRGSRRFYFPEPGMLEDQALVGHNWSFIQAELSIALTDATTYHDLPADFLRFTERPTISGGSFPLEQVSESVIRSLEDSASSGGPQYYAVKRSVQANALSYRVALHPQPTGSLTLEGWYLFQPPDIDAGQDPVLTANHAETLLASILMTADEMMNYETQSEGRHLERFKRLLASSIVYDQTIGAENNA